MKRAYIFCAGCKSVEDAAYYRRLKFSTDDLLICADGGYDLASAIGVTPTVVIGDFDSITSIVINNVNVIKYPTEKNQTDLHLCIDYALDNSANEIILLGAFGGRIDHSIAAMFSLGYIAQHGAEGMLLTRRSRGMVITDSIEIPHGNITKISLIPLTETVEGVTTFGLKYPLTNATLYQTSSLGVSNEFSQNIAKVTIKSGMLFVICEEEKF